MRTPAVCVVQAMFMRGTGDDGSAMEIEDNEEKRPSPPVTNPGAPGLRLSTLCVQTASPFAALLTCREVAPRLLEHEKALLVIKEHDYAKAPESPELLQLSALYMSDEGRGSELTSSEVTSTRNDSLNLSRKEMKEILLGCRSAMLGLRENLGRRDEESACGHLREVISLQVSLIREQQEQLHEKDKELHLVRKEKEQLQSRLERMERRLSVLQKHSKDKHPESERADPSSTGNLTAPPYNRRLSRAESLAVSEHLPRSRSASVEATRTGSRPSSHSGTPTPQGDKDAYSSNSAKKHPTKRKLKGDADCAHDAKRARKKSLQPNEVRTALDYCGLNLPIPVPFIYSMNSVCNHDEESKDSDTSSLITVPSWREKQIEPASGSFQDCEDTSDEMYLKRHKKPEEDEKRRKRWDLQRLRAIREHEELLRKYKLKSGQAQAKEKKREKLTTFEPKLYELEAIEVMETVAVSAFGRPLPLIPPSEFEVSWFDLDVREAKETVRTTRSKAKAARLSVGSSEES